MLGALVLGIVQGITEFFPVSSTAHLILIPRFFGLQGEVDTLVFDVAVHAGTLLSLLVCFGRDLPEIIGKRRKLLWLILLGTVPAGVLGVLFAGTVESTLRSPGVIALMLTAFGVVMFVSERFPKRRDMDSMRISDAVLIGAAQAVALIPGVSRSGATISAGIMLGLKREEAARFSFLLSMPVVLGAVLYEGRGFFVDGASYDPKVFIIGFASSALAGVFAIKYLLGFLKRHGMDVFVYYRFLLALLILGMRWPEA